MFIGKEYPVESIIQLEFDGSWPIRSQRTPSESIIDGMSQSVYY